MARSVTTMLNSSSSSSSSKVRRKRQHPQHTKLKAAYSSASITRLFLVFLVCCSDPETFRARPWLLCSSCEGLSLGFPPTALGWSLSSSSSCSSTVLHQQLEPRRRTEADDHIERRRRTAFTTTPTTRRTDNNRNRRNTHVALQAVTQNIYYSSNATTSSGAAAAATPVSTSATRQVKKTNKTRASLQLSTAASSSSSSTGTSTKGVAASSSSSTGTPTKGVAPPSSPLQYSDADMSTGSGTRTVTSQRDVFISRAAKLRQSIVQQQDALQKLEQQIDCCNADGSFGVDASSTNADHTYTRRNTAPSRLLAQLLHWQQENIVLPPSPTKLVTRLMTTFRSSSEVLRRKVERVSNQVGPNNQQWKGNVGEYALHELQAGVRIVKKIIVSPTQLQPLLIDPQATSSLVPHVPAILARLDKLEDHVKPILERVLNTRQQHLSSIEPYLDEILERFDDIEPHLPWILENIDALAPYCGLLLKHIDALLLFANYDDHEETTAPSSSSSAASSSSSSSYSMADQLLPYMDFYVKNLDVIGPHLVLLRPHVPLLLKYNRIATVSPHIAKLFARGYESRLSASANMDVLLFWFGWTLRIPFLPQLFFALPFSPRLVSFLANRLPKKFARRGKSYCRNLQCDFPDDYYDTYGYIGGNK